MPPWDVGPENRRWSSCRTPPSHMCQKGIERLESASVLENPWDRTSGRGKPHFGLETQKSRQNS
jgi:hypothetical protein